MRPLARLPTRGGTRWRRSLLAPFVAEAIVVPVSERRSADPVRVAGAFDGRVPVRLAPSGTAAVEQLLAEDDSRDAMILVTGSLFLVGEVRAFLFSADSG